MAGVSGEPDLRERGFGGRIGFGERPALVVVDMMRGFTDPSLPLGADQGEAIGAINEVIARCRASNVPVIHVVSEFYEPDCRDAGVWRFKQGGIATLVAGSDAVRIDPRLDVRPTDRVVRKRAASAFFGTDLAARLISESVDTVIITGCSTSGCVRATAVDTVSYGLRPIVVREAVADRSAEAHRQSLIDLDAKYADVVALDEVLRVLADVTATSDHVVMRRPAT